MRPDISVSFHWLPFAADTRRVITLSVVKTEVVVGVEVVVLISKQFSSPPVFSKAALLHPSHRARILYVAVPHLRVSVRFADIL